MSHVDGKFCLYFLLTKLGERSIQSRLSHDRSSRPINSFPVPVRDKTGWDWSRVPPVSDHCISPKDWEMRTRFRVWLWRCMWNGGPRGRIFSGRTEIDLWNISRMKKTRQIWTWAGWWMNFHIFSPHQWLDQVRLSTYILRMSLGHFPSFQTKRISKYYGVWELYGPTTTSPQDPSKIHWRWFRLRRSFPVAVLRENWIVSHSR
jgi:hypothetical protein